MNERIWFNTDSAGEHTGYHLQTVRKAAEAGELHGVQRKPGGRWRFHRDCLNAWVAGEKCEHQIAGAA